ncbi:uncharacterized protein EI90DRAFT_3064801 [Cantharellus anzutake]|uniref:uncharacterized protein n=1 Tax=Cantharellus anzutake TaxID=1750568 RepID=UPI001906A691|nr:uncharacterized protein EI90DRAFT_3064801 [Cantharellus anzutake]KAF8328605.1 hypothetical protein EI90DRAFT_3064801 [Cantharellus anzutake]
MDMETTTSTPCPQEQSLYGVLSNRKVCLLSLLPTSLTSYSRKQQTALKRPEFEAMGLAARKHRCELPLRHPHASCLLVPRAVNECSFPSQCSTKQFPHNPTSHKWFPAQKPVLLDSCNAKHLSPELLESCRDVRHWSFCSSFALLFCFPSHSTLKSKVKLQLLMS